VADRIIDFTTFFLGIFIEAAPFLLLGTIASGLVEVFIRREDLLRLMPRNRVLGAAMGGMMGFVFPVCECGVVPLTQRLFRKGMPISIGIAFLLAAPIINPIALASTFAAYGFGDILLLRFALGLSIPFMVGILFSISSGKAAERMLLPQSMSFAPISGGSGELSQQDLDLIKMSVGQQAPSETFTDKLQRAMKIAVDEFFSMGKYLIIGSMIAAALRVFFPQETLLDIGSGPVASVLMMQVLAFIMSICSTVDAFVSLGFQALGFSTGSILAFLVFGPMVDIKSTMMFLGVFKRRIVFYLVVVPFLIVAVAMILLNLLVYM
jgi:hypothetical protein